MEALIDADLIAYRCAATCEEMDTAETAIARCHYLTETILHSTQAVNYTLFLTGSDNFRKTINPEYKANRKDKPRPKWLQACREALVLEWQAVVTEGIEADDAMGIAQCGATHDETVICSLDKDMLMIPGKHYNWVKDEFTEVTSESGLKHFWKQMLIGDVADNIQGIRGLGAVKASKLIDPIYTDSLKELDDTLYKLVFDLYSDVHRFNVNAKCLWIQRSQGDIWLSPEERQHAELLKTTDIEVASSIPLLNSYKQTDLQLDMK